ncbi:unnamed protein product, partial [Dovyalis caffra]
AVGVCLSHKTFDASTTSTLQEIRFPRQGYCYSKGRGKREGLDNPSRVETHYSFIWKSCTEASMFLSASPRLSVSIHQVNIRQRIEPSFSRNSAGNLGDQGVASYDLPDER